MEKKILERSFEVASRILKLVDNFPKTNAGWVVGKQVARSGTSIGANVEEAQAAYTKNDFTHKMSIALKEARETHYWLRLADAAGMTKAQPLGDMIQEAEEIKKTLGAIVSTSRKKSKL
jgi:four helix bundle protein